MWQLRQAGRDVVGMGLIVKALILNNRCNDSTRLWSVWAELRPTRARVQLFLVRTAVFTAPRLVLDRFYAFWGPWCDGRQKSMALLWRLAFIMEVDDVTNCSATFLKAKAGFVNIPMVHDTENCIWALLNKEMVTLFHLVYLSITEQGNGHAFPPCVPRKILSKVGVLRRILSKICLVPKLIFWEQVLSCCLLCQ